AFEDRTPLSLAISKGGIDIVRYLVQYGAYVHTDALLAAVETRNIEYLRFLLIHHKKADGPKADLSTSALAASKVGNKDALSLLLENGADINASTEGGVRSIGEGGETLVWFAAAGGYYRSLNLLLEKGADIGKRAHPRACAEHTREFCLFGKKKVRDCTAVQIAVSRGHWDCARLLVRHGGDLNARVQNLDGSTNRLLLFVINASVTPVTNLQILADMGADPNVENSAGETPLHMVSILVHNRAGSVIMAQILVAKGARVNCQDVRGKTPLHCAVRRGSPDYGFIEFLLKNGANPNIKDKNGRAPLYYAHEVCLPEINALFRASGTGSILKWLTSFTGK
ncbi:MAG: hypothetical protein Q9226_004280, partial [Calogaya cf. arnoldii]